jgi:hypothetical protein
MLLFKALTFNQLITKNGEAIVESGVDLEGSEQIMEDEILVHNSKSGKSLKP